MADMLNCRKLILIVDDDERYRLRLMRACEDRGFEVLGAADAEAAIEQTERHSPAYAVVDLRMPGASGLTVVRYLKERVPACRSVVLTGYGSIATALEAVRLGAHHYLTKPVEVDEVIAVLRRDTEPRHTQPPPVVPSLARVEREHIERVLAECGGNISQAARLLGIHRRSLQRKLAKLPASR